MSYIVLARKWRPQNFDELIGQEIVVRTLRNALSSGKIVHAYLFSGPRGIGKTSAARILARALNCSQGPTTEPCGKCHNCEAITNSSSVDVVEIDGASNNSVEDVRDLRESVKYAPSTGKYKIYIVDEVHMLSREAFNALLKTLEEPPPHVIFVFATTEPKKIPSTILSRCQHHAFRRISKEKIRDRLSKIAETEDIHIKDSAVEMVARAADGSMRDALTILDQASSFSDHISEEELQTLLGLPETHIILNLSDSILSGDISSTLSIIKELTERGYDLRSIMKELVEHFRNIAVIKIVESPDEFLEFTPEETEKLQHQASRINMEELTLLLTELLKLEERVRNTTTPRYPLELGLLRTSFIKGMTSVNELLKKLEDKGEGAPGNQKEPEIHNKDALWSDTIERVKSRDHLLAFKLTEAKLISITGKELTIGFNGGKSVLADSVKNNATLVETILNNITGKKLRLKIVSLPEERKGVNELKKEISSTPVIKNILELFNGKLLKVKSLENTDYTDENNLKKTT